MTKGMKYERDRPQRPLQCQKSPQELGFDLDPHKGIAERNLEKKKKTHNIKKPYVSQLEKDTFLLQSQHVRSLCALQDPERCSGVRGHFLIHPTCAQAQALPQLFVTSPLFPDNFFLTLDTQTCKPQPRCTLLGPFCERVLPKGCIHENMTLDLYDQEHFPCTLNWIRIVHITQNY